MFWVAGETRMSYDPLSLIVGDFNSASLLVKSVVPGLAPGHRNTVILVSCQHNRVPLAAGGLPGTV